MRCVGPAEVSRLGTRTRCALCGARGRQWCASERDLRRSRAHCGARSGGLVRRTVLRPKRRSPHCGGGFETAPRVSARPGTANLATRSVIRVPPARHVRISAARSRPQAGASDMWAAERIGRAPGPPDHTWQLSRYGPNPGEPLCGAAAAASRRQKPRRTGCARRERATWAAWRAGPGRLCPMGRAGQAEPDRPSRNNPRLCVGLRAPVSARSCRPRIQWCLQRKDRHHGMRSRVWHTLPTSGRASDRQSRPDTQGAPARRRIARSQRGTGSLWRLLCISARRRTMPTGFWREAASGRVRGTTGRARPQRPHPRLRTRSTKTCALVRHDPFRKPYA